MAITLGTTTLEKLSTADIHHRGYEITIGAECKLFATITIDEFEGCFYVNTEKDVPIDLAEWDDISVAIKKAIQRLTQ